MKFQDDKFEKQEVELVSQGTQTLNFQPFQEVVKKVGIQYALHMKHTIFWHGRRIVSSTVFGESCNHGNLQSEETCLVEKEKIYPHF